MSHWYSHDAKLWPDADLRVARKERLVPSVTTYLSIVDKPALSYWLQKQALLEAINNSWHVESLWFDDPDACAAKIIAASKQKNVTAKADEGTILHGVMEDFFNGHPPSDPKLTKLCSGVLETLKKETGCIWSDFVPEQTFCNQDLFFAGTVDLHNDGWTIDYKTKDSAVNQKLWPAHSEQLSAYSHGLWHPSNRRGIIFLGRDDGSVSFKECTDDLAWERFSAIQRLWQISKKYGPMYDELVKPELLKTA